uniref:Uncharacterized protein n=1 Tax=Romanomermis culicivorax TaxID=13658 RepID=A0A915JQQ4_ROMCU
MKLSKQNGLYANSAIPLMDVQAYGGEMFINTSIYHMECETRPEQIRDGCLQQKVVETNFRIMSQTFGVIYSNSEASRPRLNKDWDKYLEILV